MRLILDPPRSATLNMAIDEMLMDSQMSPASRPVLRFYTWEKPAYSIGYFQSVDEIAKRLDVKERSLSIVRRMTGGGLVSHGSDLTFSISASDRHPAFLSGAKESYLKVNEAVRKGLKTLYPAMDYADCKSIPLGRGKGGRVCFEDPVCYDLLIGGKKVVGASQRRSGGAVLHQSSIRLNGDLLAIRECLIAGFKECWKIELVPQALTEVELEFAGQKEKERYASGDWARLERSFLS